MRLCFLNHLASDWYFTLNTQIDFMRMSNWLVNASHLNFPHRFFCPFFFPPKEQDPVFNLDSLICLSHTHSCDEVCGSVKAHGKDISANTPIFVWLVHNFYTMPAAVHWATVAHPFSHLVFILCGTGWSITMLALHWHMTSIKHRHSTRFQFSTILLRRPDFFLCKFVPVLPFYVGMLPA